MGLHRGERRIAPRTKRGNHERVQQEKSHSARRLDNHRRGYRSHTSARRSRRSRDDVSGYFCRNARHVDNRCTPILGNVSWCHGINGRIQNRDCCRSVFSFRRQHRLAHGCGVRVRHSNREFGPPHAPCAENAYHLPKELPRPGTLAHDRRLGGKSTYSFEQRQNQPARAHGNGNDEAGGLRKEEQACTWSINRRIHAALYRFACFFDRQRQCCIHAGCRRSFFFMARVSVHDVGLADSATCRHVRVLHDVLQTKGEA